MNAVRNLVVHCALGSILSSAALSQSLEPHWIPFQGHMARPGDDGDYVAVPDGQYDLLFTFYTAPVGGESKVWGPERHDDLVVVNGLVNALLGTVDGFADALDERPNFFARPLYVGITVDADGNPATADLELTPRQVLLPGVYARNAGRLDGRDWSDFFENVDSEGRVGAVDAKAKNSDHLDGRDWRTFFVGVDESGEFSEGSTRARDSDLLDGIDSEAIFVGPIDPDAPKVKAAEVADRISGALGVNGDLDVSGSAEIQEALSIVGNLEIGGELSGAFIREEATGYLRIGDIQICWGRYASNIGGARARTNLPAVFTGANYRVVCTPDESVAGGNGRFTTVQRKTNAWFEAQTYSVATSRSGVYGNYVAIGLWR